MLISASNDARKMLLDLGAADAGAIEPHRCRILRPHLLRFEPELILVFTVPYRVKSETASNLSEYAVPRDYHLFFSELFDKVSAHISEKYPEISVFGASDHSPIDEVYAAALAGLGVVGDNRLLITEKHGSYVFIGELYLASSPAGCAQAMTQSERSEPYPRCIGCGACTEACPSPQDCLSALTQKKGNLSAEKQKSILGSGCAWGCDICQQVCPMNESSSDSDVPFFLEERKPSVSAADIIEMSDDEFAARAYAWRGRKTILRNLELLEKSKMRKADE